MTYSTHNIPNVGAASPLASSTLKSCYSNNIRAEPLPMDFSMMVLLAHVT